MSRCRTCSSPSLELITLDSFSEKFIAKKYQDLLWEIAQIEIQIDVSLPIPQDICLDCVAKLEDAYAYIQQAKQCNQHWQSYGPVGDTIHQQQMQGECLLEAPIDILDEKFLSQKLKEINENNCSFIIDDAIDDHDKLPTINESEEDEHETDDPITVSKFEAEDTLLQDEQMCSEHHNSEDNEVIVGKKLEIETSESSKQTSKRKRGRPRLNDLHSKNNGISKRKPGRPTSKTIPKLLENIQPNDDGRFVCSVCEKTFAWRKDLLRHYNCHCSDEIFECTQCDKAFFRKDKLLVHQKSHEREKSRKNRQTRNNSMAAWSFGSHLYSEKPLHSRECRLCNKTFPRISLLKDHLLEHLIVLEIDEQNQVLKEFFPNETNLNAVRESIILKIQEENFDQFFVVRNYFGFEMSLSDTDEEDKGSDFEIKVSNHEGQKYFCALCQENYSRKHKIFQHTLDQHKHDILPFSCEVCKLSFVSDKMFDQHLKRHCRNELKRHHCSKCPGRFMWSENLEQHSCLDMKKDKNYQKKANIQEKEEQDPQENNEILDFEINRNLKKVLKCCLCLSEFNKLSELQAHLPSHADGYSGCNTSDGLFYKTFYPEADAEQLYLIAFQISEDFRNFNISRFYFAADHLGNERFLNDSETEDEDNLTTIYSCDVCFANFNRRKMLLDHQKSHHSSSENPLPHICCQCQKGFVSSVLLIHHLQSSCNDPYRTFKCEQCDATFVWNENYQKHLATHTQIAKAANSSISQNYECLQCHQTFHFVKELSCHSKTHAMKTDKFSCPHCDDSFKKKDHLKVHLKTHAEVTNKKENRLNKLSKNIDINEKLCKPHGCKHIQCMICLSKHSKILDLRAHLLTHHHDLPSNTTIETNKNLLDLFVNDSTAIFPLDCVERIKTDLKAKNFERFYCITNEVGYELQLSSSETDSESDEDSSQEKEIERFPKRTYTCELCNETFQRKFLIYKHQRENHKEQEAPYACTHCNSRFLCNDLLDHHNRTQCKNLQKRFHCRKCPLRFMWHENLRAHLQQHLDEDAGPKDSPDPPVVYECTKCDRSFMMLKDLTRHMVMHNSSLYNLKCLWCPRKFYRKTNLLMHIERHGIPSEKLEYGETLIHFSYNPNGKKNIFCKICEARFSSIRNLRLHLIKQTSLEISAHHKYESMLNYSITNERGFELDIEDSETDDESLSETREKQRYTCLICQLSFKRKYQMALHQKSVHKYEALPLKCGKCIFKTASTTILDYHKRTQCFNEEKEQECPKCSFKFMWQENLTAHIQMLHGNENPDNQTSESLKETLPKSKLKGEFYCDQCPCKYNRKDRLTTHKKKRHSLEALLQSAVNSETDPPSDVAVNKAASSSDPTKKKTDKKFLCAFCGKAVTSSSNLIIHMRRHTGEKPFKCDFCDMAFPRSSDLQCHRRTHTGEKPHQCTVCGKAFSRSYKLQQHMRIHSGERPYKCTHCEKSFTQSNDLTLHIRRHTGERPYICGICGERFIQGTALKNHRLMRGHFEEIETPKSRAVLEQF